MQSILITGGAGFIGAHFVELFSKQYPNYCIVNVDKLTYASHLAKIEHLAHHSNYHFIQGDITNPHLLEALFKQFKFDGLIHMAAESHVDNSILDPNLFVQTNIQGTHVVLYAAYNHWFDAPQKVKPAYANHRFLYVSTDEVYGALPVGGEPFLESSALNPSNPYSASKAAGECLVKAYRTSYGLQATITRSTNNYGPGQHKEKLIPMILSQALEEQPIYLHGDGRSMRDWLHVKDHCRALDLVFHKGLVGQDYNISADNGCTNLEVAYRICRYLDRFRPLAGKSYRGLITFVQDRVGQDKHYALNHDKIAQTLGWQPIIPFEQGLEALVLETIWQHRQGEKR